MSPTQKRRKPMSPSSQESQSRTHVVGGVSDHLGLGVCVKCGARMADHFGRGRQFVMAGASIHRCH